MKQTTNILSKRLISLLNGHKFNTFSYSSDKDEVRICVHGDDTLTLTLDGFDSENPSDSELLDALLAELDHEQYMYMRHYVQRGMTFEEADNFADLYQKAKNEVKHISALSI